MEKIQLLEPINSDIEKEIYEEIYKIDDPDVGISIVELGLVYSIKEKDGIVNVKMTLTSMGCPAGPFLEEQVRLACLSIIGVKEANVEIVWLPRWDVHEMTSEDAKMQLGIF